MHFWKELKIVQLLRKIMCQCLTNLIVCLQCNQKYALHFEPNKSNLHSHANMYMNFHSTFIYNSQKVETT